MAGVGGDPEQLPSKCIVIFYHFGNTTHKKSDHTTSGLRQESMQMNSAATVFFNI